MIDQRWPEASERKSRPGTYEAKGVDEKGNRKSYYGKTAYEASRKAAESLNLVFIEDSTLHSFYVLSYWQSKKSLSQNWKDQIRWAYDGFIGKRWGKIDLQDIDRRSVQLWFNTLTKELEPSSIKRIKIVFSGIMGMAVEDDLITRNPISAVRTPKELPKEVTTLALAQIGSLLEHTPERLKPTIIFLVCGMRIGEACAPDRSALRVLHGVKGIQVTHQILQNKGGNERTEKLKTPQSNRFIPLPDEWYSIVRDTPRRNDMILSCSSDGTHLLPNNISRELVQICTAAGIPVISPHKLRHTFISILENELEAPAPVVARLAGKTHSGATQGYSHTKVHQLSKWMARYYEQIESSTIGTTMSVVQNA